MPYADPERRRERQKQYRQTAAGRAAAERSHARFTGKRRGSKQDAPLTVDPAPLTQALNHWRTQ